MSKWRVANDVTITVLRRETPQEMTFVKNSSGIIEILGCMQSLKNPARMARCTPVANHRVPSPAQQANSDFLFFLEPVLGTLLASFLPVPPII